MMSKTTLAFLVVVLLLIPGKSSAWAAPVIANVTDNRASYLHSQIPRYQKLEISFDVDTTASNHFLPYDPSPPNGIRLDYPDHVGVSVDAVFLPPDQSDWSQGYRQPAFYYQFFDESLKDAAQSASGRDDWRIPTGTYAWMVRFAPNVVGAWRYRLEAQDASGISSSQAYEVTVSPSEHKGFLGVSQTDSRYFAFDDGSYFVGNGWHNGESLGPQVSGTDFTRDWYSSMYGTAWTPYQGTRNLTNDHLPRPGLLPVVDPDYDVEVFSRRVDYNHDGNTGWFDQCMVYKWDDTPAIKPNATYQIRVDYQAERIRQTGPADSELPYGFVARFNNCLTGTQITDFGGDTANSWGTLTGTWSSGSDTYFMPKLYLGLNNMALPPKQEPEPEIPPIAKYHRISFREILSDGSYGPELMDYPSINHHLYVSDHKAAALDEKVASREAAGVYAKWVVMEKNDTMYFKMNDDGSLIFGPPDNADGFYGLGREVNATRWYQQAWWRYAQARWGFSTSIHSWELTNEGDPTSTKHYELADEFAKYMKCRVFGLQVEAVDGATCEYDHPNSHMVTTSFWDSFPGTSFWKHPAYPNMDYADVHAYIKTSNVIANPSEACTKAAMELDAAAYHACHSNELIGWNIDMPIVRGEAGMDTAQVQDKMALKNKYGVTITDDPNGTWLHNFTWARVAPGGMYDLYWWEEHLVGSGFDYRPIYQRTYAFLSSIPLDNGQYEDAQAVSSNQDIRAWGQKDVTHNRAHLWIQNKNHTWKNVVDGVSIEPISSTISFDGFPPHTPIALEWWDTWSGTIATTDMVVTDADGRVQIAILDLVSDTAIRLGDYSDIAGPPSSTDYDGDGDTDWLDLEWVISLFRETRATIFEYAAVVAEI